MTFPRTKPVLLNSYISDANNFVTIDIGSEKRGERTGRKEERREQIGRRELNVGGEM